MCGIAGWLGSLEQREEVANRVAKILIHRGPDSRGIWSRSDATLVHTRLSIIDLSAAGAQPIGNQDGTIWCVFNGEIYNHHELRRDLEAKGHVFNGRSDSEVLPHLYEEEGPGFVDKLRGMFALAIYDTRLRRLVLARDRFGIKPLLYAPGKNRLAFASEINALLEIPDIDCRPDGQAIYDFAALFYIPAPQTFYIGIRALQPGEVLEAQLDGNGISWKTRSFRRWIIAPDPGIALDQAIEQADALITRAVHRQMESDVPLGALLSGGIDSSLISAMAQDATPGLRTFNVRFSEKEYDETWAAEAVAKHIGSHHVTLDMDSLPGTWERIRDLLLHAGQPFADTSLFAVNAVCQLIRQHVAVALSGDGGDEGFGGYDQYWQIAKIAHFQMWPTLFRKAACLTMTPLARFGFVPGSYPQRCKDLAVSDDISIIQNLFCWVREEEQSRLCLNDYKALPIRRLFEPQWEYRLPRRSSHLERLSALTTETNVRLILPNDFLFKVDTASMKESLEVRVPMLDEDLFSFGLSLPYRLKVKGRICKRILREVASRHLPSIVAQKPKWGFGIPVDKWVDSGFKLRLREALLGPTSHLPNFFRREVYHPMVEAFCHGRPYHGVSRQGLYQRVIMLLAVELTMGRRRYR